MVASFKNKRRERRGVAAVIGGVILTAILLTSVLTYFIVILDNDRARKSYEIFATDAAQERGAEVYSVLQQETLVGTDLKVNITNDGSLPIVVSQVVLYCTSAACPSSEPDIDSNAETLNAKEETDRDVGPITLTDGLTYRVDVISDRGNIISTEECTVDATAGTCATDEGGDDEAAGMENIAQGTGSVQLDFKSYAAIFPDFLVRDTIDQTGRYTQSSNAKGYPGKVLYSDVNTIIVQRLRNLDSTDDLRLTKNTALIVSFGGTPGNQPPPEYICKTTGDPIAIPPTSYVDSTGVLLERVPFPYPDDEGWKEIHFCRNDSPSGTIDGWKPDTRYSFGINPVFMVMRAKVEGSQVDYAQTIPYQAFNFNNNQQLQNLVACLYNQVTVPSTAPNGYSSACDSQISSASAGRPYQYRVADGSSVWVHINSGVTEGGTSPYYIELLDHDGTSTCLSGAGSPCPSATLNASRNISITIPAGTDPGYYTIKVADSSNITGNSQGTVYLTVQVT